MSQRIASGFLLLVAFVACGHPAPRAAEVRGIDPLCRSAETLAPGSRLAAATDGATPRYAVRLRGGGELAMAGFVNEHTATLFDVASGDVGAPTSTGTCAAKFIKLPAEPGGFGEYCVVFEPTKPKGYSTFDLGFSTEPHKPPTDAEAAAAAKMCK